MRQDFSADNTMPSIIALMGKAMDFLQAQKLSPRSLFIAELVLEELLTNTVKYAYDDEGPHRLEVIAEVGEGRVSLEFHDDGHFFDPCQAAPPLAGIPLAQRQLGGRGIHLVRTLVDQFDYRREGGRNIVCVGFPSAAPGPTTSASAAGDSLPPAH